MEDNHQQLVLLEKQLDKVKGMLGDLTESGGEALLYEMVETVYDQLSSLSEYLYLQQELNQSHLGRLRSKEKYLEEDIKVTSSEKERAEQEVASLSLEKQRLEEEIELLREERVHLNALLSYRDHEIGKMQEHINKLTTWINRLQSAITTLLQSKRWKIGCYIGDLKRKMLFRPREALEAEFLEEVLNEYEMWKNELEVAD